MNGVTTRDATIDGRAVRWYEWGEADARLAVLWHHGTPNVGEPPEPLFDGARRRGLRFVGLDRPGYGGSERVEGRSIADAARLALAVADAAGLGRFAVLGHSGGGPHALATAALAPDRVVAAVSVAGLAPHDAEGLDLYAGMHRGGEAELRAAARGGGELAALLEASEFDPEMFTPADHAALAGDWGWFGGIAARGVERGLGGMVDDDRAYTSAWGVTPAEVAAPTLLVHGTEDRIVPVAHGRWLAGALPHATLEVREGQGHLSALGDGERILDWLAAHA